LSWAQQLIFDGFGLAFVVDRGKNEVGGKGGLFVDIEQNNLSCLFLFDNVHKTMGKLQAIQIGLLRTS
jgi:hypothetical protein